MADAGKKNKVKFGLKNVHIAVLTEGEDGTVSWGTPFALPGAVSLSLDAEGETSPFYADDIVYYQSTSNSGYSGDLEVALVTDEFREQVLKEEKNTDGVVIEDANVQPAEFAMMFEFNGDVKATRHVMYRCTCTRPSVSGETTEDTKTPTTESMTLTAVPLADGRVKAKTTDTTSEETYNGWYNKVYEPAAAMAG